MGVEQTELFPQEQECEQHPALPTEMLTEQPEGTLSFDGRFYVYDGYALVGDLYVKRHLTFMPDEAGVLADCELDRVRLMVDDVCRDADRQREITRFGKRIWHSRVRPERAVVQALDYAFAHDSVQVNLYLSCAEHLFANDPVRADTWTGELRRAYMQRKMNADPLRRLVEEAGVSGKCPPVSPENFI